MKSSRERITEWWSSRERRKKINMTRHAQNSLVSRPANAAGDVEVEATSGPMCGKKVRVSKYPAEAAYFKA